MSIDLAQLRVFFALAHTLNFTEAAKRLFVTQSAVSHSLRKLEKGLGIELLARRGKSPVLTENGRILLQSCETIFSEIEKAEEILKEVNRDFLGTLRLGATVEFGTTVLMKYMKKFIVSHPEIRLDFSFRNDLFAPLLNDDLDIIVDCKAYELPQLERIPLFREKYVVVASPEYIRDKEIREPHDLSRCVILSIDKGGLWWSKFLSAVSDARKPVFGNIVEIDHIRGLITAAIESIGVAFVPKYSILRELKNRSLAVIFPAIAIPEDRFTVYQKRNRAGLLRHRIVTQYIRSIQPREFGESDRLPSKRP